MESDIFLKVDIKRRGSYRFNKDPESVYVINERVALCLD
jgi:hypothetical protein